ncbi:stage II sporulation protein P, partial [Klebsiella pneumoniae]|nr:stage II sporulation protein P [Klebsiella pneumoniae]
DLSPHAMLVEIGGVDNNLDELNRTVDILAEAINDYYQKAKK